jgi:hypothetical protein
VGRLRRHRRLRARGRGEPARRRGGCWSTARPAAGRRGTSGSTPTARSTGGGAFVEGTGTTPVLERCTFTGNYADGAGGSCAAQYDAARLPDRGQRGGQRCAAGGRWRVCINAEGVRRPACTIVDNSARRGGGILVYRGDVQLHDCVLENNRASGPNTQIIVPGVGESAGGAIYLVTSNGVRALLSQCRLWNNRVSGIGVFGGAIADEDAPFPANAEARLWMSSCTVAAGYAETGGGVYLRRVTSLIQNSILYANKQSPSANNSSLSDLASPFNTTLVANLLGASYVTGAAPGDIVILASDQPAHPGLGTIFGDPKFLDVATGDLRLDASSPCIDGARTSWTWTCSPRAATCCRRRTSRARPDSSTATVTARGSWTSAHEYQR